MDRRKPIPESAEVRAALVAELAHTHVPTAIMGATLVGVGLFAYAATGSVLLLAGSIWGGLACVVKLGLMTWQVRLRRQGNPQLKPTARWAVAHAVTTLGMASAVGALTCSLFGQPDVHLQLLATGLLFGYGSGIVARTALRPRIAALALALSAGPAIVAAALGPDTSHRIVASIFAIFLLGALDSIRHVHRTATRHIAMRLEMARLAHCDALTGIPNRLGLWEAFRGFVSRPGTFLAIHCLDLDGFKPINDRFGHGAGDAVLIEIARRLAEAAPIDAVVARLGGDEFVVMQGNIRRPEEAHALATYLHAQLGEAIELPGRPVSIGVSLGFALAPAVEPDFEALLRRADEASYRVKRMGGGVAASATDPMPLRAVA